MFLCRFIFIFLDSKRESKHFEPNGSDDFNYALIFLWKQFWIISIVPKHLNFCYIPLASLSISCLPTFWWRDIKTEAYWVYPDFTSRPASNTDSVFFLMLFTVFQWIRIIKKTGSWSASFNFNPFSSFLDFLTAYSRGKQMAKCSTSFWIGNMDKLLSILVSIALQPLWTLAAFSVS
jgi:hypothetical protein